MIEWTAEILDSLVVIDPEQLSSSTDENFTFFYIDISSVNKGHIDYPVSQIQFKGSPSRARKTLKLNDVLMSTVRPNLKSFAKFNKESKFTFVASTGFAILRAKQETDIDFIYQSLFSEKIERQIQTLVVGSNYPAINSSDVRKLLFDVPDFPTQRKIARILSTANAVIEKTQAAIAKYKAIKQGMLHDLFTRGIDPATNKLRPTYEDAPHLYKESKLGWIPKEWEVETFENTTIKIADRDHFTPIYFDVGVPIISPKDFDENDEISFTECKFITNEAHLKNFEKTDLKSGDLVFTRIGALLGKVCIVKEWMPEFSILHSACMIRVNSKTMDANFYLQFIKSKFFQKQIKMEIQSIGVPDLGLEKIKAFLIYKPLLTEQKTIGEKLISIDRSIKLEQTSLNKWKQIKAGLMADLLSGKKSVIVDEELAS